MVEAGARTALVYDFDGTLAPGSMQEHSFIPAIGMTPEAFWSEVKSITEKHNVDEILVYMWRMLAHAKAKGLKVTKAMLESHGSGIPLFPGVEDWFSRINEYGRERGLLIEHYIISSGIYEIIRGCRIRTAFKYVYASKFIYEDGVAVWPGAGINYTSKTQHLFRINKGIETIWDNRRINRWVPLRERPIPFERMLFLGDGETDVPAMKTVREKGGYSLAVFDEKRFAERRAHSVLYNLIAENRVHFVVPADYREGTQLDLTVKGALGAIARDAGYRGVDGSV